MSQGALSALLLLDLLALTLAGRAYYLRKRAR